MSYILNKTNGKVLTVVEDGSINRVTDLTFVGKNYAGYGEIINEDLVKLLENFANSTQPPKAITGQLWYDTASKKLKVYNGTRFNSFPYVEISSVKPTNLNQGDFWFNPTEGDGKLYVITSSGATLIGPISQSASSVIQQLVVDSDSNNQYVLRAVVNGSTKMIISSSEFTVRNDQSLYSEGFTTIKKGITLPNSGGDGNSYASGNYLWGTASTAVKLRDNSGGLHSASDFVLQSTYDSATVTGLNITNDYGITVGTGGIFKFHAASPSTGKITAVNGNKIAIGLMHTVTDPVNPTNILNIDGNVIVPGTAVAVDLGTSSTKFSTAYISTLSVTTVTSPGLPATPGVLNGTWTSVTQVFDDNSTKLATTAYVRSVLPAGVILMWSGSVASIPAGWVLCNGDTVSTIAGSITTPDLRNMFVVGTYADSSGVAKTTIEGSATKTGGYTDSIVVSHSHTATSVVSDPGHHHTYVTKASTAVQSGSSTPCWFNTTTANTGDATTGITVATTNTTSGVSGTNRNLPPYYALAYIMKL